MTRIALICHGFPEGGVSRINLSIAERVSKANPGMEFVLFADHPVENPPCPFPVYAPKNYLSAVKELGIDILVECSRLEKNTQAIHNSGVKVIYADHGQPFGEQYAILDRRMGGRRRHPVKRLLWYLFLRRQFLETDKALRLAIQRTARAYQWSDAYVCLCEAYVKELQTALNLPENHHLVSIENPQEPVQNPSLEKEKRILYCGRLSDYDKKVDRLLRIWAKVQEELPDYSLDIVGDGYERTRLEEYAQELHLKRIHFHGNQTDLEAFYRKASVLCLTSETEGWGLVLTEAQAHGVIPVAFNCSAGVAEVIGADAGILVPPRDEEAFAQALVNLCQRNDLPQMRLRCIERAKRYTLERNTQQWEKLFRDLSEAPASK